VEALPDPDFVEDAEPLKIGKAFHLILELAGHSRDRLDRNIYLKALEYNKIKDKKTAGLVIGMVDRYLILHESIGMEAIAVEIEVGDEQVLGFVDLVLQDPNSKSWWISDLKTASVLSPSLLSRLTNDPQLSLYSFFAADIAKKLDLDPELFAGCRYRVTTKPKLKISDRETATEFSQRISEASSCFDIPISKELLRPKSAYLEVVSNRQEINDFLVTAEESEVSRNFAFCEQYFKPCAYWSKCYGQTFSQSRTILPVTESRDLPDNQDLQTLLDLF
jgi:hypothetical protein